MTMLSIVQDVCDQIQGISRPSEVVGSSDAGLQQMLRLLNKAGKRLAKRHDWSRLTKVRTFTGIATQAQTGEPPTGFRKFASEGRIYNVDTDRPLMGTQSQDKFTYLTLLDLGGIDFYWTMIDGVINITPTPAITNSFKYTYISKNWARPAGATDDTGDKAAFTVDTDTTLLDEELLTLDLVWRWKHAKGLEYAEDMRDAEDEIATAIAQDRGPHTVSTAHVWEDIPPNIWPYTIG